MSRYAVFLQIEAWEVITQERTLISCVNLLITRKCPYPQSTDWGFSMSLREAKQLVVAELRDIDTETVGVVSAIALDETTLRMQDS